MSCVAVARPRRRGLASPSTRRPARVAGRLPEAVHQRCLPVTFATLLVRGKMLRMTGGELLQALTEQRGAAAVAFFLADAVLTCVIVAKVPYTEIDWIAYMEEVEGVMGGVSRENGD